VVISKSTNSSEAAAVKFRIDIDSGCVIKFNNNSLGYLV